jgi:hypothetical protein
MIFDLIVWINAESHTSNQSKLVSEQAHLASFMDQKMQRVSKCAGDATQLPEKYSPIEIILEYSDDRDMVRESLQQLYTLRQNHHEKRQERIHRWANYSRNTRSVLWEIFKASVHAG